MGYSAIDIVFGILLIIGGIIGYRRGLFKEFLGLVGIFLAVWGAFMFGGSFAEHAITAWEWNERFAVILSFIIVFVLILLVIKLIAIILTKVANFLMLGCLNRLLGMVLAICKVAIILSICLNALLFIDPNEKTITEAMKNESLTYRPIENIVPTVMPYIKPGEYLDRYRE